MEEEEGTRVRAGKNTAIDYEKLERDIEEQKKIGIQPGKLNEALEALLSLEKQMRLAGDITGTKATVLAVVRLCREADAWKALNENIVLLSKRRAQLKQAVAVMVQDCMKYVDEAPDDVIRTELIKTLNTVTAGKMYVEIERARLVKRLAKMQEAEGKIKEAAETMQELAVETFGAMAKTEKIAFILEQVRLCLDSDDYMRAQILAKKISPRAFADNTTMGGVTGAKKKAVIKEEGAVEAAAADVPSLMELKLKFYELMIRYYRHSGDYLEISRCYQNIYETPDVQADPARWMPALKRVCWFVVLAPHGSMQSSLLNSTYTDARLLDMPQFKSLLKQFITMEVIAWPQLDSSFAVEMTEAKEDVFSKEEVKKDLQLRVIQHNILVISKYYSRITMKRLSELLSLSIVDTEKNLSDMVVEKVVTAKIDRPAGIVTFGNRVEAGEQALDKWAGGISRLLELVETSCHHIHKEAMVHKVTLKS